MSTMSVTLPGSRVPILVELSNVRRVHEHAWACLHGGKRIDHRDRVSRRSQA